MHAHRLALAMNAGLVLLLVLIALLGLVLIVCCCARACCSASWSQMVESLTCGWCGREEESGARARDGQM